MEELMKSASYKWFALGVVVIGTFMAILDSSIVNIAIPKMMAVFGVSLDSARWIITAYSLALGAVVPLTGYLSDTFGTKKVYIFSLVAFTLGSLFCGLSWNNNIMIVSRIIQGIGGGMIMPVSMAIIYQIIPREERGMALGFWGIAAMAAPAIGPTLSGYIIEYLDWRLIFTLNIPIGVVAVIIALLVLQETPKKSPKSFDYVGFVSSVVGIVSLLYVLGEGSTIDWNDVKNIMLIIIGFYSLLIFVVNELMHPEPLLDLRVLKIFPFTLSLILSSILNMVLFGVVFIIPLFLQNLKGLSPMQTGMIMFPSAIATGLTMPIGGKLFDKFGAKPLVIPGLIILAVTTYGLSKMSLDMSDSTLINLLIIRGIGLGLAMMPTTSVGMNAVSQEMVARASALSNTVRQIASAVSVTILTTLLQHQMDISFVRFGEQVTAFNTSVKTLLQSLQGMFIGGGIDASSASGLSQTVLFGYLQKQSYLEGINTTLLFATFFACLSILIAMFLKDAKHVKTDLDEADLLEAEVESSMIID